MFTPSPIKRPRLPKSTAQPEDLPTIAIDFDGVVHDKANPVPSMRMGAPIEGAKEALNKLKRKYLIIIHTVMATSPGGREAVEEWLRFYDIPFAEVTAIKPNAICYLDDKALKFTDWQQALNDIARLK